MNNQISFTMFRHILRYVLIEAHHPLLTAEHMLLKRLIGYKNGNTDIYKITLKNHKGDVIGDVIATCYVQLYEHEHICMSCSLTVDPSDKDRYEFLTLTEKDCLFTEDDLPFDSNILNMLKGLRKVLYILIFENHMNDVYNDRFKCRAKEPDFNGWIYGYYVHNEYAGEDTIIVDDESYEIDRNTLCQNTCVRAYTSYENRTPETKTRYIYEGDIVKVFGAKRLYCVALIVYNYLENEFECKPIFNGYEMSLSEYNDYEVIGNKFDNPEMLDEEYYINNPDEFDLNKEY